MAKILTWAEMPTGITKGSPTYRCPTRSMIASNVQSGYAIDTISTTDPNQLVTSVTVKPLTGTIIVSLMCTVGVGARCSVWIGDSNGKSWINGEISNGMEYGTTYPTRLTASGVPIGTTLNIRTSGYTILVNEGRVPHESPGELERLLVNGLEIDQFFNSVTATLMTTVNITLTSSVLDGGGGLGPISPGIK